jgi:Raf kinase inhibitor-like YbhB/YbcL family protein
MVDLQLHSPAFSDHDRIPDRFSRLDANVSPPLAWSQVPGEAVELLLVCEDPDAPGGTFLHWLVTGIDPATSSLAEGQVPDNGRQWTNGFGKTGWGGPKPPAGDPPHRYVLQLHALARPAQLPSEPSVEQVHDAIKAAQPLASGTLTGTYSR